MNIRLVKNGGDVNNSSDCFDLPSNFSFDNDALDRDYKAENRIFQDGGKVQGFGVIGSKEKTVSGRYLTKPAGKTVDQWSSELLSFCIYNEPLRLYIMNNNIDGLWFYSGVYLKDRPRKPIVFAYQDEIEMTFIIENPYRKSESLVTETFSGISNNSTFSMNIAGLFRVSPVLTITAKATNSAFSIINTSDNFLSLDVSYPNFLANDIMIADCENSTLIKNSISLKNYMNSDFIKLVPGANVLKYTGQANIDLVITYRNLRA